MISRLAIRWFVVAQGCRSVHQRREEGREAGWSCGEGCWFLSPCLTASSHAWEEAKLARIVARVPSIDSI